MWVLDHPEGVAEGIGHGGDLDAVADILNGRARGGAEGEEAVEGGVGIVHTPVGNGAAGAGWCAARVGIETELVAADVKAHVERLVEVGLDAEHGAVPGPGFFKIWRGVENGAEALEMRIVGGRWLHAIMS